MRSVAAAFAWEAIHVYGAAGVTEDHPLSMFYRAARFARISDDPDEAHQMVVARRHTP